MIIRYEAHLFNSIGQSSFIFTFFYIAKIEKGKKIQVNVATKYCTLLFYKCSRRVKLI